MKNRTWKLIRNLFLILLLLAGFWMIKGKPLPMELAYRRALRSYFIEEPTRLWRDQDRILSRDKDNLYIYQQDGYMVGDETIQTFPIEDGKGFAMVCNREMELPLEIWAWEESGQAVTAKLKYEIWDEEDRYVFKVNGEKTGKVFYLPVLAHAFGFSHDGRPYYDGAESLAMEDIYQDYLGYRLHQSYKLTIQLLDERGGEVGIIHKTGGVEYEDR